MRLCFVLLPESQPLLAAPLEKALKEFPDLGAVSWQAAQKKGTRASGAMEQAAFSVGGIDVLAALMPMPVPEGEADEATERSLSGFGGSWTLPEHRAHLVVAQQKVKGTKLADLTAFTRVVAAIVRATNAVGVYWGEGGATHHPEFVVNIAHTELPLPIWVGVSVASTDQGQELLSVGMKQLGLPDLLLFSPEVDGAVFEFFYDLLAYVTRRGKRLPEGDSVGRTEKEKLKVHYMPSPLDPSSEVWSVRLPEPKTKTKKPGKKKVKAPRKPAKKKKQKR